MIADVLTNPIPAFDNIQRQSPNVLSLNNTDFIPRHQLYIGYQFQNSRTNGASRGVRTDQTADKKRTARPEAASRVSQAGTEGLGRADPLDRVGVHEPAVVLGQTAARGAVPAVRGALPGGLRRVRGLLRAPGERKAGTGGAAENSREPGEPGRRPNAKCARRFEYGAKVKPGAESDSGVSVPHPPPEDGRPDVGRHEHPAEFAPDVLHADRAETPVRERAGARAQTLYVPRALAGGLPAGARRAVPGGPGPSDGVHQPERAGRRLRAPDARVWARRGGREALGPVLRQLVIAKVPADQAEPDLDVLRAGGGGFQRGRRRGKPAPARRPEPHRPRPPELLGLLLRLHRPGKAETGRIRRGASFQLRTGTAAQGAHHAHVGTRRDAPPGAPGDQDRVSDAHGARQAPLAGADDAPALRGRGEVLAGADARGDDRRVHPGGLRAEDGGAEPLGRRVCGGRRERQRVGALDDRARAAGYLSECVSDLRCIF